MVWQWNHKGRRKHVDPELLMRKKLERIQNKVSKSYLLQKSVSVSHRQDIPVVIGEDTGEKLVWTPGGCKSNRHT